jgi:ankyrin repeat protein
MATEEEKIEQLSLELFQIDGSKPYLVRDLVEQGADVNMIHPRTRLTPLVEAIKHDDFVLADALIGHGANVNQEFGVRRSHLSYAIEFENIDMVKLLLSHGAVMDVSDIFNELATLGCEDEAFSVECLNALLRAGFEPGLPPWDGFTSLMYCIVGGATCLYPRLIDYCDPDAQDNKGDTALHLAIRYQQDDAVDFLLGLTNPLINLELRNNEGDTALHIAMFRGYTYGVERLLAYEVDVNAPNHVDGNTPLHLAVCSRRMTEETIQALFRLRGPDINLNARNDKEETPLHVAIRSRRRDMVHLLIENGADLHHIVKDGMGYLEYAERVGFNIEIIEEIRSHL